MASNLSRRQFLGTAATAVLAGGTLASGRVFGANGRIGIGVVGLNGRGWDHVKEFAALPGAQIAALCDVDADVLERRAAQCETELGFRPATYRDMRELFTARNVDAVSFATPNHWHALGTIWACEAGKDVYVEKPISHNVYEGRQIVEAAKRYERIIQHGTQRRSERAWARAIQRVHDGEIGDLYMARVVVYKQRDSIGMPEADDPPDWLDWDLWQGPARARKYSPAYVHYNWHWFWEYGNGDLGNNAVHFTDVALWALRRGLPKRVYSIGGRFGYEDAGQTPNTQTVACAYEDGTLLNIEVRGRATNLEESVEVGLLCYGTEGYMADTKLFSMDRKEIPDSDPGNTSGVTNNHFQSFVNAVNSRRPEDIRGTALDGHLASAVCHFANISYQLNREVRIDQQAGRVHMDARANTMLTRKYREGFEVPDLAGGNGAGGADT